MSGCAFGHVRVSVHVCMILLCMLRAHVCEHERWNVSRLVHLLVTSAACGHQCVRDLQVFADPTLAEFQM